MKESYDKLKVSLMEQEKELKEKSENLTSKEQYVSELKKEILEKEEENSNITKKLEEVETVNGSLREMVNQTTNHIQEKETEIKEIVLTGVNVGDFGKNHGESFFELIQELDIVEGIERYRISSIEPNLITDEIINFTAKSEKFLPHFHIPLQSGSDHILKAMRRRYNSDLFVRRINKIKSIMPDACIGVDVIVGFPGESEEKFEETYELLKQLDVSYLHVFSYSQRDNTEAVKIEPKVSQQTIAERSKILHRLSMKKKRQFYENNTGKIRQVLFETYEEGILSGHSENYISVSIKGNEDKVNQIIPVKLVRLEDGEMIGKRLE